MKYQRTHNEQQDPKAFADTRQTPAEVREHLAHVQEGITQQKQHIHELADSQTSWFQIKQNIRMLMHEETFHPTSAMFETFGFATYQNIRYDNQRNHADAAMNELRETLQALLNRLKELEPDAPEFQPAPEEPTGQHADTRVRKNEYQLKTRQALLNRLQALELGTQEVKPAPEEPTGTHADTRVRKNEYPDA